MAREASCSSLCKADDSGRSRREPMPALDCWECIWRHAICSHCGSWRTGWRRAAWRGRAQFIWLLDCGHNVSDAELDAFRTYGTGIGPEKVLPGCHPGLPCRHVHHRRRGCTPGSV